MIIHECHWSPLPLPSLFMCRNVCISPTPTLPHVSHYLYPPMLFMMLLDVVFTASKHTWPSYYCWWPRAHWWHWWTWSHDLQSSDPDTSGSWRFQRQNKHSTFWNGSKVPVGHYFHPLHKNDPQFIQYYNSLILRYFEGENMKKKSFGLFIWVFLGADKPGSETTIWRGLANTLYANDGFLQSWNS